MQEISPSQPAKQRLAKQTTQSKVSQNCKETQFDQNCKQNIDEQDIYDVRKVVHGSHGINNNATVTKQDESKKNAKQSLIDEFDAIDQEFETVTTPRQKVTLPDGIQIAVDEREELEFQRDEEEEQLNYDDIDQVDQVNPQLVNNISLNSKNHSKEIPDISDDEIVFPIIDRKKRP